MRLLAQTGAIVRKDLLSELRSGEVLLSMLLFALLLVLVFSFAFMQGGAASPEAGAGVVWVTLAFSGVLGISRSFDREREADGLRALLLSPADRNAIYLAKVTGILLFMAVTAALVLPLVALLFDLPLREGLGPLVLLLFLGTLGFSLLGAFFGALMASSRSSDLLFSITLFPLLFPVLIAGALGTSEIFTGEPGAERVRLFTSILVAFDALVAVVALWSFERMIVESGK